MDTDVLVALTGFDVEKGKNTLSELDKAGFEVSSAFWFYFPDIKEWRLLLAIPSLDTNGPKETYSKVQTVVSQHDEDASVPLWSIGIISPNHPINRLLQIVIKTGEKSIAGIRFTGNVVNGTLIDDAYIYRVS